MCWACDEAKRYFKECDISFKTSEVKWDAEKDEWVDSENARRMRKMCGDLDFIPQILINDRHIQGWKELQELIQSGEIESILKE